MNTHHNYSRRKRKADIRWAARNNIARAIWGMSGLAKWRAKGAIRIWREGLEEFQAKRLSLLRELGLRDNSPTNNR